jgi:hypothetical protein
VPNLYSPVAPGRPASALAMAASESSLVSPLSFSSRLGALKYSFMALMAAVLRKRVFASMSSPFHTK